MNYSSLNSDFTVDLSGWQFKAVDSLNHDLDWEVTLAYTGETAMTGARIAIATEKCLNDSENFAVTLWRRFNKC